MNTKRALILYSVIRVVLFAGVFTLLMLLDIQWWLSAALAALISLCIAYIFFSKTRDQVSAGLYALRTRTEEPPREDDEVEDAVVDRLEAEQAAARQAPAPARPGTLEGEGRREPQREHQAGEAG